MALAPPIPGANVTQGFGPSSLTVEPAMYADGSRAWWNPFIGSRFASDFHAALDLSAPSGTPILASEAGTVVESLFDATFGGGNKVRIQIRPGVSYCSNHMATRRVKVGQHVERGQVIGTVGSTGASTGPHDHFWVGIVDQFSSEDWPTLYDPDLFLPGGAMAGDPRIRPLPYVQQVQVNGPGINIRVAALRSPGDVFANSREDGIYRISTDNRIASLGYRFTFVRWQDTTLGVFAIVTGFRRRLAIRKSLLHFVQS